MKIQFVVVGGSVAAYASALALSRAGHDVVVLVVDALGVAAVLPEAAVPEAEVPLLDVVPDAVVFEVADSVALAAVWNDSKDFSAVGLTANT